jgi:hypothetical protein
MLPRVLTAIPLNRPVQHWVAILCVLLIAPGGVLPVAGQEPAPAQAPAAAKLPPEQLDSLVAPIALYPDPMLTQTLVASTYPLEIVQLQQWLAKNPKLKDKELADAVAKQGWDPSIQGMAGLPDVVKRMAENIKWTTDLGNAFLAQQSDVMDAVQRMRKKAQDAGNLKPTKEQKVETKVVEQKQVIVIEQASPQVVYVPSYNPTVVYGPPVYPYPPIYYPPPGYYAAGMAISFGVGVAMGAMWSGGWGYGCGWGHNDVNVNVNNNFNRNTNINRGGNTNIGNGNRTWQHNPQHRGAAPYSDRATANKYGGSARGDSMDQRRQTAQRQQQGARANTADRGGAGGNRASTMDSRAGGGDRGAGVSDRSSGGRDASSRGGAGVSDRSSGSFGGGGGDRVGSRQTSSGGGSGAFGGSGGYSGSSARASSSRGSSSMGSSRGGGGGGSRGGGGGRRR